jgi:protein-S-isoprenylcysteine O-methyltransferase Ste14
MSETVVFKILFVVGLVAMSLIRTISLSPVARAKREGQVKVTDERKSVLETMLLYLTFIGMFVLPILYLSTSWLSFADYILPDWLGWLGAPIFAIAGWLLWRSHADLGRNWSGRVEIKEGQTLATQGVYRTVRHPMYSAHLLWGIAQALLLQNWLAGVFFFVSQLALYAYRIPREEQIMLDNFGQAYREHMSRTGRLLPRLVGFSVADVQGKEN